MMKEPLYLDLVNETWVDTPEGVSLDNLVRVYDVDFSHFEEISSTDNGTASSDDEQSRADAYKEGDPRESMRSTYFVVHAYYEYNGEHGCLSKTADTLLCTMTIKDDGMGNVINDTFTPNASGILPKSDILDLIKDGIIATVKSSLLGLRERAYVESALGKIRKEFDLMI